MIPFEGRHCDSYIRDKSQPMCLRKFILFNRIPAMWSFKWRKRGWPVPKLFATWGKAEKVRVVMASRFGDVGISKYLNSEFGYQARVYVEDLKDFSEN